MCKKAKEEPFGKIFEEGLPRRSQRFWALLGLSRQTVSPFYLLARLSGFPLVLCLRTPLIAFPYFSFVCVFLYLWRVALELCTCIPFNTFPTCLQSSNPPRLRMSVLPEARSVQNNEDGKGSVWTKHSLPRFARKR